MNRGKSTTSSPAALQAVPETASAPEVMIAPLKPPRRSDLPPSLQKAREQQQELAAASAQAVATAQETGRSPGAGQNKPKQGKPAPERSKPVRQKLTKTAVGKQEAAPAAAQGILTTITSQVAEDSFANWGHACTVPCALLTA